MTRHYTIPVFVPHLACPFQCIFCDQEKISGHHSPPDIETVKRSVDKHLSTIPQKGSHIEIGFFGGTFTGIPVSLQASYLEMAKEYLDRGQINGVRLSTRPDYIDEDKLSLLKDFGVTTIELGAQSMDDGVLRKSGRGHSPADTEKASEMILENGFRLGLQMMIGLPGDTPEKAVKTARKIVSIGAAEARIYPVLVIKGTPLERLFNEGKYQPLSLTEAIIASAKVLQVLEEGGVTVTRIGLHPSDGLLSGEEYIAGPFHPSFRELVMTRIWEDKLAAIIPHQKGSNLLVEVPPSQLNFAIGHKSANRKLLERHFKVVRFIPQKSLKNYELRYNIS